MMLTVFKDMKGLITVDLLENSTTVNSTSDCQLLGRDLHIYWIGIGLPKAEGIVGILPSPKVLTHWEMPKKSSKVWSRLSEFIFYDDNTSQSSQFSVKIQWKLTVLTWSLGWAREELLHEEMVLIIVVSQELDC